MATDSPLLSTKLRLPTVPPGAVVRPRLLARLGVACERRLTLLSTPPGFGKSTLLAQWAGQASCPVAWYSLDASDGDPAHFWRYCAKALASLWPCLGQSLSLALQSPQPPPGEAMLVALINDLAAAPADFVLILDDYHLVQAPAIHQALAFLVEHLPSQAHLVVASRADPPFPLPRLRARGQLLELRAEDLRFSTEEAAAFLAQTMRLGLAPEQVEALVGRTEGWAAGLQLAALALQTRAGVEAKGQFVAAFAGSHRFVLDYLVEEVLERQPPAVQHFLLKTSILDRLTAQLCNAVTGEANSQAMLAQLEAANLFLVPLDGERRWYRYHRLFADLLRTRLGEMDAGEVADLHHRASRWYEAAGMIGEAVSHALAGGDHGRAADLVEQAAMPMLLRGEIATVLGWLGALPADLVCERPWLAYNYAWNLLLAGRARDAEAYLVQAEEGAARVADTGGREAMAGHLAAIRAYLAAQRGEMTAAVAHARLALERLPEHDAGMRGCGAFTRGWASFVGDDVAGACAAFGEAGRLARQSGNVHVGVPALAAQAGGYAILGQLRRARATYDDTVRLIEESAGRQSPLAARPYSGLSDLYYEWNDLEAALRYAGESVRLGKAWGNVDVLVQAHLTLAQARLAVGDLQVAEAALGEAEVLARRHLLNPSFQAPLAAGRARMWLSLGQVSEALRWVEESGLVAKPATAMTEMAHLAAARVLLATGQAANREPALALLARLAHAAEAGARAGRLIKALAVQARALAMTGERQNALAVLGRALTLAEPEGYARTFVDEGAPLVPLLVELAARGPAREYAGRLLAVLGGNVAPPPPKQVGLAEPLSEREIEVLRLLAAGRSNEAIARELVVAVSTVKSHVNHIFGKLGVASRTQAIAKGREMGIL